MWVKLVGIEVLDQGPLLAFAFVKLEVYLLLNLFACDLFLHTC